LIKLEDSLPHPSYLILKSYLTDRLPQVKYNQTTSHLYPTQSGVPQGSVLAPVLYNIYTADLPTNIGTEITTFADDSDNGFRPKSRNSFTKIADTPIRD
jgi:hypothetical protein